MTNLRLFILQPEIIFAARVNVASPTYPLDSIAYDTVTTGSAGSVWGGETLLLGTTAGADDLGRQRVRLQPTPTLIRVGRSSLGTRDGELTVQDNAYISIVNLYQVWAKIPVVEADGTIYKDSVVEALGNVDNPPPKANGGAGYAGTINPATGLITVEFDGGDSFQFDAALSSALSVPPDFLWDVGDGTITVGTATSQAITATFPAGFRYVHLTVTNDSSDSHTHHIPVFARDPASDLTLKHQVVSHRWAKEGQEISFRIVEDVPRANYPDGTLVMLWDDDLQTSDTNREHMLFIGWLQNEDGAIFNEPTATLKDAILHCVDTAGRLRTLPGFSQYQQATDDATLWTQTEYPNIFYYFWYLLYWHSTALEVSDLLLGSQTLNNFAFNELSSDAGDLYTQVNNLANNVTPDHYLNCNRINQLLLAVDPLIQNTADRSSTILDTISNNSWMDIRWTYNRAPRVHKIVQGALLEDNLDVDGEIITVWSMAPGMAEGQGLTLIEESERITETQFSLNVTTGNRYARLNARYGPFTIIVPYSHLNIAVNPLFAVDPANMLWVRLTVGSDYEPPRGLPFTNQRGLVHEINIAYEYSRNGLSRIATLTWEMETSGSAAETYTPPEAA